jgi:proteasome lid subunit RPN8/RPN11
MTSTVAAPKFTTWSAPGHSFRIEYSGAVLDEIRMTAVEGYHRVPHGGVETGGILFGTRLKSGVRINAWRPIACEYAKGPSFLLSEKDEAALAETLQSWRGDADLAGLEPAGWYRAHTRSEILLSDADLSFFNRFFPQPWQIGLIVRPASFSPTRVGFFFREADAGIRTQSSYREFVLNPLPAAPPVPEAPPVEAAPEAAPVAPAPQPEPVVAAPEPPAVERHAPVAGGAAILDGESRATPGASPGVATRHAGVRAPRQVVLRKPRKWYAVAAVVLIVVVLGFLLLKPSHQGLSLSATDMGGQLRVAWDRAARSFAHATSGTIEIDDHGVRTEVKLTPADLRTGSLFYARQSGDVVVRMTVDLPGKPPVAEMTRFLRPGQVSAPPAEQASRIAPQPVTQTAPPAVVPSLPAPAPVRHVLPFRAPDEPVRESSAAIPPPIAPPSIDSQPATPQAGALTSVLGSAPAPLPAPAAPPRPKTAAPAASGRIVWTGKLPKNGRLAIEGNHASSGGVSGALPASALRVSAYPGDLTAGGITLFTADPRYSKPLTVAAGADNGWNPTTYTLDEKRAAGIKVLEQPSAQNGYKLVLEADTTKLSVVMLEWHAVQ